MDLQSSIHADYIMKTKMFLFKVLHFAVTIALFYFTWRIFRYGNVPLEKDAAYRYNYFVSIMFGILLLFFNNTYINALEG